MELSSIKLIHFRRFFEKDNKVVFARTKKSQNHSKLQSTLIVGQNNAGKTSVITALLKACKSNGAEPFNIDDFNYKYLEDVFEFTKVNINKIKQFDENLEEDERSELRNRILPFIKFEFEIQVSKEDESNESLTFIAPLLVNEINETGIIEFSSKYEISEEKLYFDKLVAFFDEKEGNNPDFREFLLFLTENRKLFDYNIYSKDDKVNFSISELIKINKVSYDSLHQDSRLSKAFNRIYKYKVNNDAGFKKKMNDLVGKLNKSLEKDNSPMSEIKTHTNDVLKTTISKNTASMELRPNMTFDLLLEEAMKYVYRDGHFDIPEDQFGSGYTCLMLIIAEIINYVNNSSESDFTNKINLLVIDEPECYMHPQLQRLFIKNINVAIEKILQTRNIDIDCQIVITSHSPNILKGKIDVENTFDYINYAIGTTGCVGKIIPLSDSIVYERRKNDDESVKENDESVKENDESVKEFEFLKKHIKYNACEVFFSEACLVVEGYAEEIILPYYIDNDEDLNKRYITILNVNGAHSRVYKKLFETIQIPVAIITDIDIKRPNISEDKEKEQIETLDGTKTTNGSLKCYGIDYKKTFESRTKNIFISTQNQIGKYFPSSFEESLILTNPDNGIIKKIVANVLDSFYTENVVKGKKMLQDISHELQIRLAGKKGMFSTSLLYELINHEESETVPTLPQYIVKALDFIKSELNETEEIHDDQQ